MTGWCSKPARRSAVVGLTVAVGLRSSRICAGSYAAPRPALRRVFSLGASDWAGGEGDSRPAGQGAPYKPVQWAGNGHAMAPPPVADGRVPRLSGWGRRTTGSCRWRGSRGWPPCAARHSSTCHSSTRFRAPMTMTGLSGSSRRTPAGWPGWSAATGRRTPPRSRGRSRSWPGCDPRSPVALHGLRPGPGDWLNSSGGHTARHVPYSRRHRLASCRTRLRKRAGRMRRPFASREYSKLPWNRSTYLLVCSVQARVPPSASTSPPL